jgi:hypothetical protein
LGLVILLVSGTRLIGLKGLALGTVLGVLITFRPQFLPAVVYLPALTALSRWLRDTGAGTSRLIATRRAASIVALTILGVAPWYTTLRVNCYNAHHEQCIMGSKELDKALAISFEAALLYSRWDVFFRADGVPVSGPTWDQVIPPAACQISRETPTSDLTSCYLNNLQRLPLHFTHRLIGAFENRHLNLYAGLYTPTAIFWNNRVFSSVGFIGVIAALVLAGRAWATRGIGAHLWAALLYTAIQLNFHPESRYMFPVTPLFFLVALSVLIHPPFEKRWQRLATALASIAGALIFLAVVTSWDPDYFARYEHY